MSQEDPIANAIAAIVDAGALAGASMLVWRGGKVVRAISVGWRDLDVSLPIERDTLFRVFGRHWTTISLSPGCS